MPAHIQLDDLVQEGMIALLDVLEKYDQSKNDNPRAWVAMKIRYSLMEYRQA